MKMHQRAGASSYLCQLGRVRGVCLHQVGEGHHPARFQHSRRLLQGTVVLRADVHEGVLGHEGVHACGGHLGVEEGPA